MNELSLFTGAGGGVLGSILLGHRIVGYVEIDEYCQKIIAQRIKDGILDEAPIFSNIQAFNRAGFSEQYRGVVDVISAGFPCQPFSTAGKRKMQKDHRNMWPETKKTISAIKPKHVLLENVRGISKYLPVVIKDLRRIGYTVERPIIVSAAALGAGHLRRRIWIYAHINGERQQNSKGKSTTKTRGKIRGPAGMENSKAISTDIDCIWKLQPERIAENEWERISPCSWWKAEPGVVRVVYGVTNGMDRIKSLGNSQIPIMAATAFRILQSILGDLNDRGQNKKLA